VVGRPEVPVGGKAGRLPREFTLPDAISPPTLPGQKQPAGRMMLDGIEVAARNGAKREGELQDGRLALLTIADLTAIRNLIRGGSVIDWHRLYFSDRDQVDRFLRVHEFDPDNSQDMARLEALREQAVDYLEHHLGFHIPEEVAERIPARDSCWWLRRMASGAPMPAWCSR